MKQVLMDKIVSSVIASTRVLLALLIAALATGCASVSHTDDTTSLNAARDMQNIPRAERVFLYQSHVANTLLDHYPLVEILETADPSVVEAEARMTESCSPLTQAALTKFEGDKPSLGLRFRVMTTIDECERAARKMDELLNDTAIAGSI